MAVILPWIVGVASAGLLASVVKIIAHKRRQAKVLPNFPMIDSGYELRPKNISLNVNDADYNFVYLPESSTVLDLAIEFCSQKGLDFGFDLSSVRGCTSPIIEALTNSLRTDNKYRVEFGISSDPMEHQQRSQTRRETSRHSSSSQHTDPLSSTANQPTAVAANQTRSLDPQNPAGDISSAHATLVRLEVNGVTYAFEHRNGMDHAVSATELAAEFCQQRGVQILKSFLGIEELSKIATKAELVRHLREGCQEPIATALTDQIRIQLASNAN